MIGVQGSSSGDALQTHCRTVMVGTSTALPKVVLRTHLGQRQAPDSNADFQVQVVDGHHLQMPDLLEL